LFGCQEDGEEIRRIPAAYTDWLGTLDERGFGDQISYDQGAWAEIVGNVETDVPTADCAVEGQPFQCTTKWLALEFVSGLDSTGMELIFHFIGDRTFDVGYWVAGGASNKLIFRQREPDGAIENWDPATFTVNYRSNYTYRSATHEAVEVTVIDRSKLRAVRPPRRFVLVKGVGVTEWSDYAGNTFTLE
jgi:hypothetical protein